MREWRKIKRRKKKIDNIKNQINRKILLMKQGKKDEAEYYFNKSKKVGS